MTRRTHRGGTKSRLATNRRAPRRPNRRRRRRKATHGGGLPLAIAFTVLVGINIYVFFFRGGTSIRDLMKASAMNEQPPAAVSVSASPGPTGRHSPPPVAAGPKEVHGSMRGYLGLSAALTAFGVGGAEVAELVTAMRPLLNMRTLTPTQRFDIVFDSRTGQVSRFTYHVSSSASIVVQRDAAGRITVRRDPPAAAQ